MFPRTAKQSLIHFLRMKHLALLSMITVAALVGCKKKQTAALETPAPAPATETAAEATPPADGAAAQPEQPVQIVRTEKPKPLPPPPQYISLRAENALRQGVSGTVDPFLTQQLRIFVEKNHRMPESFHEFVNTRLDSIPRPPEGTKWVIDTATLQVKSVKSK